MGVKVNKKVVFSTIISLILFVALIVTASLSPLSNTGLHSNKFNSAGMWISVIIVCCMYIIPLLIYLFGIDAMKYIIAVVVGIAVLAHVIMGIVACTYKGMLSNGPLTALLLVCIAALIINILWYMFAFSKK